MKKSLFVLVVIAMISVMSVTAYAVSFSDVQGHWAESYINRWAEEKVINGYEDNTFGPNNNITRAEFVAMIMRIFEPTQMGDLSHFTDVDQNAWYYDTLSKGSAMGAIKGYEDNTIRPNDYITRQEAMVILNRILNLTANTTEVNFIDAGDIASWAESAVLAFAENGYINGYEDGSIHPTSYITRAEITKILDKAIARIITQSGEVDLTGIQGHVVIKAENVTLMNEDQLKKVFALNDNLKATLKTLKEVILINSIQAPVEEEKPITNSGESQTENGNQGSSGGQGGSGGQQGNGGNETTTKKFKIEFTSNGDEYKVTREGSFVDGAKVTFIIDGKTILKDKVFNENEFFQFKLNFLSGLNNNVKNKKDVLGKIIQTVKSSGSSELEGNILGMLTDEQKEVISKIYNDKSGKSVSQLLKELSEDETLDFGTAILGISYDSLKNLLENM